MRQHLSDSIDVQNNKARSELPFNKSNAQSDVYFKPPPHANEIVPLSHQRRIRKRASRICIETSPVMFMWFGLFLLHRTMFCSWIINEFTDKLMFWSSGVHWGNRTMKFAVLCVNKRRFNVFLTKSISKYNKLNSSIAWNTITQYNYFSKGK